MNSKAFSLMELGVVLVIIGILAALMLPAFTSLIEKSKAQAAQNNLYAIAAAQSQYYEDHNKYCTTGCGDSTNNLMTNLGVLFGGLGDPFTYSCTPAPVAPGCSLATYTCTAKDGTDTVTLTLNYDVSGCSVLGVANVLCTPPSSSCF